MPKDYIEIPASEAFTYGTTEVALNAQNSPDTKSHEYEEHIHDVIRCEDFYIGRTQWIYGASREHFDSHKLADYLPKYPAETADNKGYFDRVKRTLFHNFFRPSVDMFVSLIANFTIHTDFPDYVSLYFNNVDLRGSSLPTFKSAADTLALRDGFVAIVCSYPSLEDIEDGVYPRPYLQLVERKDFINHAFEYDGSGAERLTLAVIARCVYERNGLFGSKEIEYRWVYFLDEDGYVNLEVYRKGSEKWLSDGATILFDEKQRPLTEIPITLYSVTDINPTSSPPPLIGLQEKNQTFYQVFSDYQRLIMNLQPIWVRTSAGSIPEDAPPLILGGGSKGIDCSFGSSLSVVQADPSGIQPIKEFLADLKEEIKSEALSFLGDTGSKNQTDDEIALRIATGKASLKRFAILQESHWQTIFSHWLAWLGEQPFQDSPIMIDTTILDKPANYQEVQTVLNAVLAGTMDTESATTKLRQMKWLSDDLSLIRLE